MITGNAEILDKPPPADAEAERGAVALAVVEQGAAVQICAALSPDDFLDLRHRAAFLAIDQCVHEGEPPILDLVLPRLKRIPPFVGNGAAKDYLTDLIPFAPTAGTAGYFVRRVRDAATRRRMIDVATEVIQAAHDGSKSIADTLALAGDSFLDISATTAPKSPREFFRLLDCLGLAESVDETEYLIDGVLVAAQPCLVGGASKTLKTSLLVALAISLATGEKYLGRFDVARRVKVVLLSGESGLSTLRETAARIADSIGWSLRLIDGLYFGTVLPRLDDAGQVAMVAALLADTKAAVLVIDPAYLCMPSSDAGNLFAQGVLLGRISEVCQQAGATLILAHHTTKRPQSFDPVELPDLAWAGFGEFARQWILLGRRERFQPGSGEHRLWFSVGGSAGHSGLWALDVLEGEYQPGTARIWQTTLSTPGDARDAAEEGREAAKQRRANEQLAADKQAVLKAAAVSPAGETKSMLRDRSGVRSGRFSAALSALLDAGDLEACQLTRANGQKYDGYRLSENQK